MACLVTSRSAAVCRPRLGTAVALASLVLAAPALAQTRTALSWVREPGAESCIASTELGRRVERIVGPVLASAPDGQVSIEGRIAKDGAGFAAHLLVSDGSGRILGRREVRSADADCRALDDQLAFVIAVAVDPDAALAELPGDFAQDGDPGAELRAELQAHPPRPAPFVRRRAQPAPSSRPPRAGPVEPDALGASVSVGLAGAIGVLSDPTLGATARAAVITGSWSHGLRAALWLPVTRALGSDASVDVGASQLGLSSCPLLWARPARALSLCAGGVAALLWAEPHGFAGSARSRWLFWPALDVRWAWRLGAPLWLGLAAGVQSLWPRHRIVYESAGTDAQIHRVPPIMGTAELALELRF